MRKDPRRLTLKLSVLFSSFAPVATFTAFLMNTSATQLADFTRRTAELGVLILAYFIYSALKENTFRFKKKKRLARILFRASGGVLVFSGLFLIALFIRGLIEVTPPSGDVRLGLLIATLGLLANAYFSIQYTIFNRRSADAVMESQGKLYQAKTIIDLNVVIALSSVLLFEASMLSYYIDQAGTFIVAVYLLVRGLLFGRKEPGS